MHFTAEEIVLNEKKLGEFTLQYPALYDGSTPFKLIKPSLTVVDKTHVQLHYDLANVKTQVDATMSIADGKLSLTFASVPDVIRSAFIRWMIPMSFCISHQYQFDDAQPKPFPATMSEKPAFDQSHANSVKLIDAQDNALRLQLKSPVGQYLQFQDNRHWNWKIFQLQLICNLKSSDKPVTIDFMFDIPESSAQSNQNTQAKILVDTFGQSTLVDYPTKVNSEKELADDVVSEKQYYASLTLANRDQFGGLPGSQQTYKFKATGFFHVDHLPNGRSVLVDPQGNLFFQVGVCAAKPYAYTYTKGRREIYEWLPDFKGPFADAFREGEPENFSFYIANYIRKYGSISDDEYETRIVDRLKRWGFNAYGAFSGSSRMMPTTPVLPVAWGVPELLGKFIDPFDPTLPAILDKQFAEKVAPLASDPHIIGYFLHNEQAFGDLPIKLPQLHNAEPAKVELVKQLQDKYQTIEKFNKAWALDASGFDVLKTTSIAPSTDEARNDMAAFTRHFLHAYFKLMVDTYRKHDPNHMLLGNRFLPANASTKDYVSITAEYVDVFSVNYYTYAIEKDFLKRISRMAGGKPIILSEWSFGTNEQGLAGGVRDVTNQTQRGYAYRNYVEQAAALTEVGVVGTQWFSLVDQPVTGRWFQKYNGEAMNIGLLDVTDRPFKDFLKQVKITNDRIYDLVLNKVEPYSYDNPRFASKSAQRTLQAPNVGSSIKVDGLFSDWTGRPSERLGENNLVMGQSNGISGADFWVGWDKTNLYVYVTCQDPTPCANFDDTGKHLWNSDAVELFIGYESITKSGPMLGSDRQIIMGANPQIPNQWQWYNTASQPEIQRVVVRHADGQGWTLEAAIPWEALGVTSPKTGTQLRFDLAVDESDGKNKRQRQFMYSGSERNSSDRGGWGILQLVD
jgi:hypothetical protein